MHHLGCKQTHLIYQPTTPSSDLPRNWMGEVTAKFAGCTPGRPSQRRAGPSPPLLSPLPPPSLPPRLPPFQPFFKQKCNNAKETRCHTPNHTQSNPCVLEPTNTRLGLTPPMTKFSCEQSWWHLIQTSTNPHTHTHQTTNKKCIAPLHIPFVRLIGWSLLTQLFQARTPSATQLPINLWTTTDSHSK